MYIHIERVVFWTHNIFQISNPPVLWKLRLFVKYWGHWLLCEESRFRNGILRRSLVKGQLCHASGSFSFIKWSNEGCLATQSHFHAECHINPVNQPLYVRQATDVRWNARYRCKSQETHSPQYSMKRDHRSHSKFCATCINMFVIFIMWDSFGKRGQEVLSHPDPHAIASPYPQKWVLSSSGNIRWPISSDFKLDSIKRLCTCILCYTNNIFVVRWYAVDDASRRLHLERCDNSCYRIKCRPRECPGGYSPAGIVRVGNNVRMGIVLR